MGIDIKNITTTSATLYYVGTSIDYNYSKEIAWYVDGSYRGETSISPGDIGSNGLWLSGLNPNEYYSVRAYIVWHSGGGGAKEEYSSFTTLAQRPVIHSIDATPYKSTVWVSVNASYTTSYDYSLYYRSGNSTGSLVESKNGRQSSSIEFAGLKASTQYRIRVTARNSSGTEIWDRDFTTLENPRPSNWMWSDRARRAFNRDGFTSDVLYTEWNSFVNATIEFYKWYWNRTDAGDLSGAIINSSDKTLYARKFNGVRYAIGGMVSTGITEKFKGDNVIGSYFLTLESKMNSLTSPRSVLEEEYVPIKDEDDAELLFTDLFCEIDEMELKNYVEEKAMEDFINGNRC